MGKRTAWKPDTETPPDEAERSVIAVAQDRLTGKAPPLRVKLRTAKSGKVTEIGPPHSDIAGFTARLQSTFGSAGRAFPVSQLNRLLTFARTTDSREIDEGRLNSMIAAIEGAAPRNEVEAMLATQLAVTHELVMDLLGRTKRVDQIPQFDAAGSMAFKLLRAFAGHVELLQKLKRGGEQTVRVEHVHVHPGGNAIVGNVATGGRVNGKIEHQPHAPDVSSLPPPRSGAAIPGPALPCHDPERQPMPLPSRARQRPL